MCYGMNCIHENAMGECTCKDGHYDCPDPQKDQLDEFLDDLDMLYILGRLDEPNLMKHLSEAEDLFEGQFTYEIDKKTSTIKVLRNGMLYKEVDYES